MPGSPHSSPVTTRRAARREAPAPGYRPAFNAWLATDPAHNPNAPPGPVLHAAVRDPAGRAAKQQDAGGRREFTAGTAPGATGDKYVRDTVFLATVLFLVGISGHFRIRGARFGLIGVGLALLVFSVIQLLGLPAPP